MIEKIIDRASELVSQYARQNPSSGKSVSALQWLVDSLSHEFVGTPSPELAPGRYMKYCARCGCQTEHWQADYKCVPCNRAASREKMAKKRAEKKQKAANNAGTVLQ